MDDFEIKNRAHAVLEELLSFGVSLDTLERALRGAIAAEQTACAQACQEVADSEQFDAYQNLAAAACRNAIDIRRGLVVEAPAPTEAEQLEAATWAAHRTLDAAEKAWYTYAGLCEVGPVRTRAFDVYQNVRTARRVF